MDLDGAVTIVTGASGGIGRAVALALAHQGGRLVVTARRPGPLDALVEEIRSLGGMGVSVPGDVADPATARAVVDAAVERGGRVDLLVNAAGFGPPMPLAELTEDVWDATLDSCLKGAYLMSRAVLPAMLAAGVGRIVQISSIAGKGAEANRTAYCAAKWGLQGFSLALEDELRGTGVRVHVLNPASVATGWWAATGDPQPDTVLDRMLAPADVAAALLWLLTQPDHVHVPELVVHNAASPWGS
jgi:NAD(P)-dependent dehydrogenase (short-subunit alcohol dehydrogenase family)